MEPRLVDDTFPFLHRDRGLVFDAASEDPLVSEIHSPSPNDEHFITTQRRKLIDFSSLDDFPATATIIWLPFTYSGRLPIRENDYRHIVKIEKLDLAMKFGVCYRLTGFDVLQEPSSDDQGSKTLICSLHGIGCGVAWAYQLQRRKTLAVFWGKDIDIVWFEHMIHSVQHFAESWLLPVLVVGIHSNERIESSLWDGVDMVAPIELRTGHLPTRLLGIRGYEMAQGDYASLSAKVSGCASKIAFAQQEVSVLQTAFERIESLRARQNGLPSTARTPMPSEVEEQASQLLWILEKKMEDHRKQFTLLSRRTDVQLQAIFHLITSKEARISIAVAEDARALASTSKEDSTAMKTLAVVTVTFLPGTFVAALFAVPMFQWDAVSNGSIVSGRFWMYWAVTVPLTLLTVMPWFWWTQRVNKAHRDQLTQAREKFARDIKNLGEDLGDEAVRDKSMPVQEKMGGVQGWRGVVPHHRRHQAKIQNMRAWSPCNTDL